MTLPSSPPPSHGDEPLLQPAYRRPRRRRSGLFILIVIIVAVVGFVALFMPFFSAPGVPSLCVLVLDVRGEVPERAEVDLSMLLGGTETDLVAAHAALSRASRDPRVVGLVLRVGFSFMGPGRVEEIRSLARRFRDSGKYVIAVLEGADTLGYSLALAADEIWLDRVADLHIVGLEMQAFFLAALLEKIGLKADLVRVGRYKGTYEQLSSAAPSQEFLEALDGNVDSLFDALVGAIAEARGLTADAVRSLIDAGPFSPERALEAKLVDRLVYRDEIAGLLAARGGGATSRAPVPIGVRRYLQGTRPGGFASIALVHVDGIIANEPDGSLSPVGAVASAERARRALKSARENPSVRAVVVRVNSPGGTLDGSEAIWRELSITKDVKPVVVSMGETAASGGYYIATAANRILAQPGTITGSIGIFGGKVIAADLLDKLGVQVATASRGARAGLFDLHREFSPEERAAMQRIVEEGYDRFITRVANGRDWDRARAESVAEGRVWTGAQALDNGLVDQLGGLVAAIAEAQKLAGLPQDGLEEPVLLPPVKTLFELLTDQGDRSTYVAGAIEVAERARRTTPGLDAVATGELLRILRAAAFLDGRSTMALLPWLLEVR